MRVLILVFVFFSALSAQKKSAAEELADAERAFSALSEKNGIKESFLQYLADDCIMFNPHPVNGKELYRKRKPSPTYLTWYPTFVEVSASGDFGISTGPWELRPSKNDTTVMYGHYFSVWKKQTNGEWKVIIDNGLGYPQSEKRAEKGIFRTMKGNGSRGQAGSNAEQILDLERSFASVLEKNGSKKAYEIYSANDIRLYRKGVFPAGTKSGAQKLISSEMKKQKLFPVAAQIASSGDLGYAYGYTISGKSDSCMYIRVWRNDSGWKIAADLLEPITQ